MANEAAGFLNSKWFMISFLGGYVFVAIAATTGQPAWFLGTGIGFILSLGAYFLEYMNSINELSGSRTIDAILYRLGLKPTTLKLHIVEVEPIPLDNEKLKATEKMEYRDRQAAELGIIQEKITELKAKWRPVKDILKDLKLRKESNVNEILQKEIEEMDPVKNLYAYRCVVLKAFDFKGEDYKVKFTQTAIVTKRPWGLEIWPHQDDVIYKQMQLNTDLCYAMLIRWGMATNDIPILFTKFTDVDAFKECQLAIDAKDILNVENRVMDGLLSSQRSKYMAVDKALTEKDNSITNLKENMDDLSQLLKIAMAGKLETKSELLKHNQMKVSKGLVGLMIFTIIILIGLVAFFAAATLNIPVDQTVNDQTTSSTTTTTAALFRMLLF